MVMQMHFLLIKIRGVTSRVRQLNAIFLGVRRSVDRAELAFRL